MISVACDEKKFSNFDLEANIVQYVHHYTQSPRMEEVVQATADAHVIWREIGQIAQSYKCELLPCCMQSATQARSTHWIANILFSSVVSYSERDYTRNCLDRWLTLHVGLPWPSFYPLVF